MKNKSLSQITLILFLPLLATVVMTMILMYRDGMSRMTSTETVNIVYVDAMKYLPFMLVEENSCSTSFPVAQLIDEIIAAHGLMTYQNRGMKNLLTTNHNINPLLQKLAEEDKYSNFTSDEIMLKMVEMAKKDADELGQLLLIKVSGKKVHGPKFRKGLDDIGVAYAGVYNDNILDNCICMANECIKGSSGYPVFKSNYTKAQCGTKDNLEQPIATHFDKPKECLRMTLDQQNQVKKKDFPTVSEQTLFEFEYNDSEEAWNESVSSWMKILRPFLSGTLDKTKVEEVLSEHRGSRSPPAPHSELISNYDSVVAQIRDSMYVDYVRDNLTIARPDNFERGLFDPLVLVFEGGCSASTAVGHFVEVIINAHGLERYQGAHFEYLDLLEQFKNPLYHEMLKDTRYAGWSQDDLLIETIKIAKERADVLGHLLYFKAHTGQVHSASFRAKLDELGVAYAGAYRHNVIDRCICVTKDCFPNAAGYPVFKDNGTKTDICFNRRKVDGLPPIVTKFKDPKKCLEKSFLSQNQIKLEDYPSASSEDLFEFQYGDSDEAWKRSINAWMLILRPLLKAALDEKKVIEALGEFRGSRSLPLPHSELVYNYDYLVNEVKGTEWEAFLK